MRDCRGYILSGALLLSACGLEPSLAPYDDDFAAVEASSQATSVPQQVWFTRPYGGWTFNSDYFDLFFGDENHWREARRMIDVFMIDHVKLNEQRLSELGYDISDLMSSLKDNFLTGRDKFIALDAPTATLGKCPQHPHSYLSEAKALQKLFDAGIDVRYVSVQSPLSKPEENKPEYECGETYEGENGMARRWDDVGDFIQNIRNYDPRFITIEWGIQDAQLAHGTSVQKVYESYAGLQHHLFKRGYTLSFIHIDSPYKLVKGGQTVSGQEIHDLANLVRNKLGVQFGLSYTSAHGGVSSSKLFREEVLEQEMNNIKPHGTYIDDLWLISWFDEPRHVLPEWDASDENYPLMRTVRDTVAKIRYDDPVVKAPKGTVDSSPPQCTLYGWACDANSYGQPLHIHIYQQGSDGKPGPKAFKTTMANVYREKAVGDHCGTVRRHGFEITMPSTGGWANYYVYAIDVDQYGYRSKQSFNRHLINSPVKVYCP